MSRRPWICMLCLAAMTATASAQSAHVQAEALFRQGKELMAQKKLAEACAAFEGSQQLEPNISTLLNHADCREKNAQLATAWGLFVDAEHQTHTGLDATSKQLNAVAAARASQLEARLSKLSIGVPPESRLDGLEVLRGTDRVNSGAWNLSLPIDGGTYKITARAPGRVAWSTTVIVKPEGDVQTVAIPKLDPEAVSERPARAPGGGPTNMPPADARSIGAAAPRAGKPPPGRDAQRSLVLPIVMGSAALVLGGTAFGFSRWGDSLYGDSKREPDDAKQEMLWQSANKRRYTAIGLGVGAVGCVGAALYLYLRSDREATQPVASGAIRIEPTVSATAMGMSLRSAW